MLEVKKKKSWKRILCQKGKPWKSKAWILLTRNRSEETWWKASRAPPQWENWGCSVRECKEREGSGRTAGECEVTCTGIAGGLLPILPLSLEKTKGAHRPPLVIPVSACATCVSFSFLYQRVRALPTNYPTEVMVNYCWFATLGVPWVKIETDPYTWKVRKDQRKRQTTLDW